MSDESTRSILIVDDDEALLEMLAEYFTDEKWKVFQAGGVKAAREILSKNQNIQVVLSDVRMPEGGGLELASYIRDLKTHNKNLLFFMTGYTDATDEFLKSLGAKGIFHKPFAPPSIESVILQSLKSQQP